MNRVMLDLETLDTQATAVIVSIGAVRFGPDAWQPLDTFYCTVKFYPSDGRSISRDTLAWWLTQPPEVQAALTDPAAVPLTGALGQLSTWIHSGGSKGREVWAGPATFDIAILEHAYRAGGWNSLPWAYNETRCYSTVRKLHPHVPRPANPLAHNALADAQAQADHLTSILWPEWEAKE